MAGSCQGTTWNQQVRNTYTYPTDPVGRYDLSGRGFFDVIRSAASFVVRTVKAVARNVVKAVQKAVATVKKVAQAAYKAVKTSAVKIAVAVKTAANNVSAGVQAGWQWVKDHREEIALVANVISSATSIAAMIAGPTPLGLALAAVSVSSGAVASVASCSLARDAGCALNIAATGFGAVGAVGTAMRVFKFGNMGLAWGLGHVSDVHGTLLDGVGWCIDRDLCEP